jgi:ABC-2 type transport system ATP-binding protein
VATLSNGMRARLQLARALLHAPSVLLLDEPTGSLDPVGAWELLEIVRTLAAERSITVLISSHRLEAIEALQGNLLMLDRGRVAFRGDLGSLTQDETTGLELIFDDAATAEQAVARLTGKPGVEWATQLGETAVVTGDIPAGTILGFLNGELASLRSVRSRAQRRLPDVLAELAGRGS